MGSNNIRRGTVYFFDTYSQLVATYPNGAAGVALVRETDPSHIYVWNPINNSWQDYGEYQGLEPKDRTITAKKTNFITPKVINIFDPTTAVEGAYIGSYGVTITTNTKYGYSAYIPVYKGESITLADSDPAILVHLYDSNKNKIQTITGVADDTVITPKTITISVDGFIRFNYNKSIIPKETYTVLVTRYDEFEIPNLKVTQANLPENAATTENVTSIVDNAIANLYNLETYDRMYSYEGKPASTND